MKEIVTNSELLMSTIGYFPTFHDDEIINVFMDRRGPDITIDILLVEKNILVKIKFESVSDCKFEDFNHQNVISEVNFVNENGKIKTFIESAFGLYVEIISKKVIILAVM